MYSYKNDTVKTFLHHNLIQRSLEESIIPRLIIPQRRSQLLISENKFFPTRYVVCLTIVTTFTSGVSKPEMSKLHSLAQGEKRKKGPIEFCLWACRVCLLLHFFTLKRSLFTCKLYEILTFWGVKGGEVARATLPCAFPYIPASEEQESRDHTGASSWGTLRSLCPALENQKPRPGR